MGIGASLIAEGAAGAAEGLGQGTAKVGVQWTEALHERAKAEAIALREENLARLKNQFEGERQRAGFAHDETMQAGSFRHAENLQGARQVFEAEQNSLQRGLSREQIASQEKVSAANNATALQVARIGGSVQQDKDGTMLFIDREGNTRTLRDPRDPSKPLVGFKDLTPAAKAYADVIKAQLTGLDREELSAATMGDQAASAKITERRARLNAELLNVLTGGITEAGKPAPSAPGKTGWDSTTGKVYANGQEVGTAKSEGEARRIVAAGGQPQRTPGTPQVTLTAPTGPAGQHRTAGGQAVPATPESSNASAYDAAKAARESAFQAAYAYGLAKQKADPAGYQRAKQALAEARQKEAEASAAWEREVGASGSRARLIISP